VTCIITVANLKGGVGKTTSVWNIASILAATGKRVLAVDLDPSHSLTAHYTMDEVVDMDSSLSLFAPEQKVFPVFRTGTENLSLIRGSSKLYKLDKSLLENNNLKVTGFKRSIGQLQESFDYIILDTPPSYGGILMNAIARADIIVIPVQPETTSIHALFTTTSLMEKIGNATGKKTPFRYMLTMTDEGSKTGEASVSTLKKYLGDKLLTTTIRYNRKFNEASNLGVPLSTLSPRMKGSLEYKTVTEELLKIIDMTCLKKG